MENEEVLMTLRRSRKAFLLEYACGLFLVGLMTTLYIQGIQVSFAFRAFVYGLAFLAFLTPELSRFLLRYTITTSKVTITKGVLKQHKKNVHFLPLGFVPEINMNQTRIQRLLDYGTIFVHGSGENSFEIKDIDQPQMILELIEELIERNRRPTSMQS